MASEDCGGRINKKEKVDKDMISKLPNDLLVEIISRLPMKCAVRTSILSKTWKDLWTYVTSLHFTKFTDDVDVFSNVVDRIFRSCSSPNIQKLSMHVPARWYYHTDVAFWIEKAIKREVREVDIAHLKLPLSIFSCTTLTALTLAHCSSYDPDFYSFDLPCLKALHINNKYCQEPERLMERLISRCPVLEDLTLSGSLGFGTEVDMFMVSAPTLKSLRLQLDGSGNREISVRAPNLESLYLSEHFIKYKIEGDFSSLVKANVNIGNIRLGRRYNLLHLERRDLLPYDFTLPKFDNLRCLEVITCHRLFWTMLPSLIRTSPSLEVLSIKKRGHNMPPDGYTWVGPELVPNCLRFHLSTIKLEGFKGRKHELELLSYLLGNSKVLQSLIISCQGLKVAEKMKFSEQLNKFLSKTSRCNIQFSGDLI